VRLLEKLLTVRESFVRSEFTSPKSRSSRRTIELDPRALAALQDQWAASAYRGDDELVFAHPTKGSPLDPTKLGREFMRPALKRVGITKPFRLWDDLRQTALTFEAAAGESAIRSTESGSLAGDDHRALHPWRAGALPRCRRAR
jgi:hypothetical protein